MPQVIRVDVSRGAQVTNTGTFSSMTEANTWLANGDREGAFGGPGYTVTKTDVTQIYYAALVREQRNKLLSACDWTQNSDNKLALTNKAQWASYRQTLRDLPQNTADFTNVTWPTPPAVVKGIL